MFDFLNRLSTFDRGRILSRAAATLLDPEYTGGDVIVIEDELVEKIIREAKQRAHVVDLDHPDQRVKVMDLLRGASVAAVLDKQKEKEITERLGQEGVLKADLYDVKFTREIKDTIRAYGLSEDRLRQAVRKPDDIQHFVPTADESVAFTLYTLDIIDDRNPERNHTLFFAAQRVRDTMLVRDLRIILHDKVDLDAARTPIDHLFALLGRYGVKLAIGNKESLFFSHEEVAVPPGGEGVILESLGPGDARIKMIVNVEEDGRNHDVQFEFNKVQGEKAAIRALTRYHNGVADVGYAYCVNLKEYERDLRDVGFRIKSMVRS